MTSLTCWNKANCFTLQDWTNCPVLLHGPLISLSVVRPGAGFGKQRVSVAKMKVRMSEEMCIIGVRGN